MGQKANKCTEKEKSRRKPKENRTEYFEYRKDRRRV